MQNEPIDGKASLASGEIHSFSLFDFVAKRKAANKSIVNVAMFLIVLYLLPPTLFLSNFDPDPYVKVVATQIARGDIVRKSGLVPTFARVSYIDTEPSQAFAHYVQMQCGLAPIFLLHDIDHEYLLINASQRPDSLPQGYHLLRDFGHGLLLLKKAQ